MAARLLATRRWGSTVSTPAIAAATAAAASGAGLLLSAAVGAVDGWRSSGALALVGVGASLLGWAGVGRYRAARLEGPATAFTALVAVILTQIAVSTSAYLATGTFSRVDDALFESVAGYSTTALTVIPRPQELPDGVAFWRALTQWTGGLTALIAAGLVVPVLGVARHDDRTESRGRLPLASRHSLGIIRRLFQIYGALTVAGFVLYAVAGMGPFDAVIHALTTISSGGFAGHSDSIHHFGSATVEWAAIGGMVLAGVNLSVLFRSARGVTSGSILRSAELRTFFALLVGLSIAVAVVADGSGGSVERLHDSLFAVVSMLSTTGLWATDWGAWSQAGQTLLMLAAGIGTMAGAIGGGFRVARMLAILGFIRREVMRQLHPRAVLMVKVGRRTVSEALVDRIVGHQVLYLFVGGMGSIALAITGASVLTSLTGVVSVLSTVGPAMGELTPGGGAATLSAPARAVLMPLMILGRLELAPVFVGLAAMAVRGRHPRRAR